MPFLGTPTDYERQIVFAVRKGYRPNAERADRRWATVPRQDRQVAVSEKGRDLILSVTTPLPGLPEVKLFADTWQGHIIGNHPYMAGKEKLVETTIMNPTVIMVGTSNPDYRIFVNQQQTTPSGTPLIVIVDPIEEVICTALYNRSYRIILPEQVVWSPPAKT